MELPMAEVSAGNNPLLGFERDDLLAMLERMLLYRRFEEKAEEAYAIGNPFRFRTHKEVLKLAGLDLSAERSGKNADRVVPVISKKGKGDLRYALYQAALIASSRDRHFMAWFVDKLRGREKEKGIKTKMRVKLSAKMLRIAWSLMRKTKSTAWFSICSR